MRRGFAEFQLLEDECSFVWRKLHIHHPPPGSKDIVASYSLGRAEVIPLDDITAEWLRFLL